VRTKQQKSATTAALFILLEGPAVALDGKVEIRATTVDDGIALLGTVASA
jgi:hypothetical protein